MPTLCMPLLSDWKWVDVGQEAIRNENLQNVELNVKV